MPSLFEKIRFVVKKPRVIVIAGEGRKTALEAVYAVLGGHFKMGKEVLIYNIDSRELKDIRFFLLKSKFSVLLVSHIGEYHPEKEFFSGEIAKTKKIIDLVKILPLKSRLILNYDDETSRNIENQSRVRTLTFGLGFNANLRASDIMLTQSPNIGINFKINFQGKTVPVWLERILGKENIYAALAAASVGEIFGLNLVEISSALSHYYGLPGKMKIIDGINNSLILDNSENFSDYSFLEANNLFSRIEVLGKRIIVSKDKGKSKLKLIIGKNGDQKESILKVSNIEEATAKLKEEISKGDLVLINGSKELDTRKIIKGTELRHALH
jgi:UDP-N-acetylmuramyl pentapeptide synthase